MANILVIDNDLGTFETGLRQALSAHTLHLACSGRAGLDLLRQETAIDLVLLDIMMPPDFAEVDAREGVEVLKEIKKIRPEVPVVMLTVLTGIDLIVETIQEGAFH
jgi:DNA-binding NtrC family response regulator